MFKLSRQVDLGILLLTDLAQLKNGQTLSLSNWAQTKHLPYRFLTKIALSLKQAKLIISKDPEACVGSRILLSVVNDIRNRKVVDAVKEIRSIDLTASDPDKSIEATLLSLINRDIPSCADFCELAWLYDIGYRNMMLCDELCLREDLLDVAIGAFDAFRKDREKPSSSC